MSLMIKKITIQIDQLKKLQITAYRMTELGKKDKVDTGKFYLCTYYHFLPY
jgi:hypothetical protein